MKKILFVFGMRPEAIKLCPVIRAVREKKTLSAVVCVTGQHREMLDPVLSAFGITPDYDLRIMRPYQTISDITAAVLTGLQAVIEKESPDRIVVHGDTTSAFAASVAAFGAKIPCDHVEAGLRTGNLLSPYPEEFNRRAIDLSARLLFAPTETAKRNLLAEGLPEDRVFVVGNTEIDALRYTVKDEFDHEVLRAAAGRKLILMTAHRRENLGEPMRAMFRGVRRVAMERPDVFFCYPMHKNPLVRDAAGEVLPDIPNVLLTEPIEPVAFHNLLARSTLLLTDSGGIQEDAAGLHVPVLVMRDETERPEAVEAGVAALCGTTEDGVYEKVSSLLDNSDLYNRMKSAVNPYGDGTASQKITAILDSTDAI